MSAVVARIVLRYVAGLLVGFGLLSHGDTGLLTADPELERDVALLVGAGAGFVTETAYALAKRWGWTT